MDSAVQDSADVSFYQLPDFGQPALADGEHLRSTVPLSTFSIVNIEPVFACVTVTLYAVGDVPEIDQAGRGDAGVQRGLDRLRMAVASAPT